MEVVDVHSGVSASSSSASDDEHEISISTSEFWRDRSGCWTSIYVTKEQRNSKSVGTFWCKSRRFYILDFGTCGVNCRDCRDFHGKRLADNLWFGRKFIQKPALHRSLLLCERDFSQRTNISSSRTLTGFLDGNTKKTCLSANPPGSARQHVFSRDRHVFKKIGQVVKCANQPADYADWIYGTSESHPREAGGRKWNLRPSPSR